MEQAPANGQRLPSVEVNTSTTNKDLADVFNAMAQERLKVVGNSAQQVTTGQQGLQPDIKQESSSAVDPKNKVLSTIVPSVNGAHQYAVDTKDRLSMYRAQVSPENLVPSNYYSYDSFKKIVRPTVGASVQSESSASQTRAIPLFDTTANVNAPDNNLQSKVRGLLDI